MRDLRNGRQEIFKKQEQSVVKSHELATRKQMNNSAPLAAHVRAQEWATQLQLSNLVGMEDQGGPRSPTTSTC